MTTDRSQSINAAMGSLSLQSRLGPTIKPKEDFDAEAEAAALRKAMKGMGTNEEAIINCLSVLTAAQRAETTVMYKTLYGKDLQKDLKGELSGDFRNAVMELILDQAGFDATHLRRAVKGLGTNERTLIEILTTRSNQQIKDIKAYYKSELGRDLEKDIHGDTSGHFRRALISMLQANRDETPVVDMEKAKTDASKLQNAGEGKIGTDESCFNQILIRRSFPHLNHVFAEYAAMAGNDISKAISKEMSGDLNNVMQAIVQCSRNVHEFFADALNKSMKGLGTDETALTRIIVSRAEDDLEDIKACYLEKYKKTLKKHVEEETSGDYRKLLVAIIGA